MNHKLLILGIPALTATMEMHVHQVATIDKNDIMPKKEDAPCALLREPPGQPERYQCLLARFHW
jgi:hypothetical protein